MSGAPNTGVYFDLIYLNCPAAERRTGTENPEERA